MANVACACVTYVLVQNVGSLIIQRSIEYRLCFFLQILLVCAKNGGDKMITQKRWINEILIFEYWRDFYEIILKIVIFFQNLYQLL